MTQTMTLTVAGLTQVYADRRVIDDLSFTVPAGSAVALVGPNGSGKTTVLRCVVGATTPKSGRVELAGAVVDERSPDQRRAVAALLDDLDFFADLSVAEHLDLLARAHGNRSPDDLVAGLLDEVGLTAAADQLPGSLSSGQRRRLALATVFVRPRRLLVLDEPEQRLDSAGLDWLADRLLVEKESGTALLLASHDPDLVDAVADEVVTLEPQS
jgi:ABC-2 type transport system ATP-binding protein